MSLGQKEMLKRACEVDCSPVETWEAEAEADGEATANRLLEGTAGTGSVLDGSGFEPIVTIAGRYHTLE